MCPVCLAVVYVFSSLCPPQRDANGHAYYEFEYTAKNNRYTRHSLAVVVVNDGECTLGIVVLQGQHRRNTAECAETDSSSYAFL